MQIVKYTNADNTKFSWPLRVCGDPNHKCYNVQLAFILPLGIYLTGPVTQTSNEIVVPKGYFNKQGFTWYIGDMEPQTCVEFAPQFLLGEKDLAEEFLLEAYLNSSCMNGNSPDGSIFYLLKIGKECVSSNLIIEPNCDTGPSLSIVVNEESLNKTNISIS